MPLKIVAYLLGIAGLALFIGLVAPMGALPRAVACGVIARLRTGRDARMFHAGMFHAGLGIGGLTTRPSMGLAP